MYTTTQLLLLLAAMAGTGNPAPTYAQSENEVAPLAAVNVLATVNGTPITTADVQFASKAAGSHQGQATPSDSKDVLEKIILQELIYQQATQLGIDADAAYQDELRRVETEVNAFKRKKLAEVFFKRESTRQAVISDTQARAYFTANAERIRTEHNLWQILRRDEALINQDLNDIEHGVPFEKVAAKQFQDLPESLHAPWDLGYLRWKQVPTEWTGVISGLKKGQHSGIIRGPNNRFWIIKLNDRRENMAVGYKDAKPVIIEMMKNDRAQQLREKTIHDLRDKAHIVYSKQVQSQTAISRLDE